MVAITVSAPIKIFALVALLAGVLFMGAMMFMGGGEEMEATGAPVVLPKKQASVGALEAPALAKKTAAKADAAAKAKAAGKAPAAKKAAAVKPAPKPAPKPAAKPKPKPQPVVAANGLPSTIMTALQQSNVVVVSLWGSGGKIDEMARDEAKAGAAAAGAGFIALNVIESSAAAEALTLKLGVVLRTPTVLYFTQPGVLTNRLDGFRDRETVAQAVVNTIR